ncbi:MAG: tRNA pseudouridine(38-40) synthase TruA [Bifidobacteriaceae bacterium]|nr:tRNA pseudouridine(38-40) synthase TruA [Bifidobacteriaceae bacterium]
MSTRLRLDLAYDGTEFHGWARQTGLRTVQGELEAALSRVVRRPVPVTVAGRTDAGVHARGQVAHLELEEPELEAVTVRRLNAVLPEDLRVLAVAAAEPGFDARFGALWRRYCYRIADHPAVQDPLERRYTWWTPPLEIEPMAASAVTLLGEHDFRAYCIPRPGASTVRTLQELEVKRVSPGRVEIWVQADAFCHRMVRFLVGALTMVGRGRRPQAWPGQILAAGERESAVQVAPARGLTLEQVAYPKGSAALQIQAQNARVYRG